MYRMNLKDGMGEEDFQWLTDNVPVPVDNYGPGLMLINDIMLSIVLTGRVTACILLVFQSL